MRLLVDNALSPKLVYLLKQAGHDVIHLRDRLPVTSPDRNVFQLAQKDDRIILSADTDFGALLANHSGSQPSFILLRHDTPASPDRQAKLVEKSLKQRLKSCERDLSFRLMQNRPAYAAFLEGSHPNQEFSRGVAQPQSNKKPIRNSPCLRVSVWDPSTPHLTRSHKETKPSKP